MTESSRVLSPILQRTFMWERYDKTVECRDKIRINYIIFPVTPFQECGADVASSFTHINTWENGGKRNLGI
jgi:hypothetical protein